MCGIFGVFNQSAQTAIHGEKLKAAVDCIRHRGPDAQVTEMIAPGVGFAHARLSIIDLGEQSNQPFHYEDLVMVFNGEVYNYIELRAELVKAGFSFRTKSDTEVIMAAYLHWGYDCVKQFNGMWSFAIYDRRKELLFCSRDRFGVKPFNYTFYNGAFFFASEIKSILQYEPALCRPDYNSISRYCRETIGAQAAATWFEGISRLPPAHNLIVTKEAHQFYQYWQYPKKVNTSLSFEKATAEYAALFKDAVALRMRSDVPVGLTLSGGVDSASIACSVKSSFPDRLKAYTASFPGQPFDEYGIARNLCEQLGYDSVEVKVEYDDYVQKLKSIVYHLESGHGSPAIYPLWHVTARASEDITVFLEGQGADELLGGYINTVFLDYLKDMLAKGKLATALRETRLHKKNWPLLNSVLLNLRLGLSPRLRKLFRQKKGLEQLYTGPLKSHKAFDYADLDLENYDSYLNKKSSLLHQTGLVNLLHYGDAISMAHSLENRLPFMDYRLVEFGFSLPPEFKVKQGLGKFIHRKAVEGMVPESILDNPRKLGFVSPLKQIFSDEKFGAISILTGEKLNERGLFDSGKIKQLLEEHKSGKQNHERLLFKMLSTELWFQNFIDGKG